MARETYPSDLSSEEWYLVERYVMSRAGRGRRRGVEEREILDAIMYVVKTKCSWRMLPHDFPCWPTVYYYYRRWRDDGTLHLVITELGR